MGIDVDAVINESENSLSEPSVQFVTLSSVVGDEAIPTYSVATSQTFLFLQENLESPSVIHETLPPQPLPNDCATQRSRKMALERNRVATPFGITASLRKMWFVQRRIQVNQNAFAIPIKYSMPFSIHLDPLNWHFVLLHYRRNIQKYSIFWIVLPRNKKTDRLEYPKQSRHPRIRESAQYSLFYDGKIPIVRIQWQLHRFNEQPEG